MLIALQRIDLELTEWRVTYRAINLVYYGHSEILEWIPAAKVFILKDDLKRPALYCADNSEVRALLARDTRLYDEFDCSDKKVRGVKRIVLNYEKRGKYIDAEELDIKAIREVERQLADRKVLRHALASAERCVHGQTADALTAAMRAFEQSAKK